MAKIAFFTEGRYYGKIPVNHPNMRTDLAWIHLLNADHIYAYDFSDNIEYDLGVIIIPKGRVDTPIEKIKSICKKIAIMQEGPCDYWTDYTLHDQVKYLELLSKADFLLCHNAIDECYYTGLVGTNTYMLPTAIVEQNDLLKGIQPVERKNVIIGGNICAWYNGMVSFILAKQYDSTVYAPSMGRKVPGEHNLSGIHHLPYLNWSEWMRELNKFKLGVHMMPTSAAGTFSLNCAYLGIPCVGNESIDTQSICHPHISVQLYDLRKAKEIILSLKNDEKFYNEQATICKEQYNTQFHSDIFKHRMDEVFKLERVGI